MKLHNYQQKIVDFLQSHSKAILSVDMGLGKTAAVLHYIEQSKPRSVLIVAPKRVAETVWLQEAQKWGLQCANLFVIIKGPPKQKECAEMDETKPYKIIGRDNIKRMKEKNFDLVVFDELTSFKTANSQRSKYAASIKANKKIGLTGTLLANGTIDIYQQAKTCGLFLGSSFYSWRALHFRDKMQGSGLPFHKWVQTSTTETILRPIINNIFTLSAEDYLDIPPVREYTHKIQLNEKSKKQYDNLQAFLSFDINGQAIAFDEEQKFAKLQQVCNGFVYNTDGEAIRDEQSDKITAVADFIEECTQENENVLLFYAFREEAKWIKEELIARHIQVANIKEHDCLNRWNNGEIQCLMANPASAGHGLNLQKGGRIVVWSSLTYNFELFAQGNARLARQGQTQKVQLHYFVAADTIEEKQVKALVKKSEEQKEFVTKTKQ